MKLKNLNLEFYIFAPVDTKGTRERAIAIDEVELVKREENIFSSKDGFGREGNDMFGYIPKKNYRFHGSLVDGAGLLMFLYQCRMNLADPTGIGPMSELEIRGYKNGVGWCRTNFSLHTHLKDFNYSDLNHDGKVAMTFKDFGLFDSMYRNIELENEQRERQMANLKTQEKPFFGEKRNIYYK